jgi:hypothetical protein
MNPEVELNLAMILFLPWFAILGVLFWVYPRAPRNRARRAFDVVSLAIATVAATFGTYWSMVNADPTAGAIWKQVLASTISYGLFLLVMTIAIVTRKRVLSRIARMQAAATAPATHASPPRSLAS